MAGTSDQREVAGNVAGIAFGLLSVLNLPVWAAGWDPPRIVGYGLILPLGAVFVIAGLLWLVMSVSLARRWRPQSHALRDGALAVAVIFAVAFAV